MNINTIPMHKVPRMILRDFPGRLLLVTPIMGNSPISWVFVLFCWEYSGSSLTCVRSLDLNNTSKKKKITKFININSPSTRMLTYQYKYQRFFLDFECCRNS